MKYYIVPLNSPSFIVEAETEKEARQKGRQLLGFNQLPNNTLVLEIWP